MTAATVDEILAGRHQFQAWSRSYEDALLFEDYFLDRERYKEELVEVLAGMIHQGPVLEASKGYGSIGTRLAQARKCDFRILCDSEHARGLCEARRSREQIPAHRYRILSEIPQEPVFELVYSVNTMHEWNAPELILRRLFGCVKPGGGLLINDLRRDANPFITEYVIREMAADETETGRHHLRTFLSSLQSAYSPSEVASILESACPGEISIENDEPMTVTAVVRKRE